MAKVTGIGGVFFKATNAEKLRAWYQTHLGIDVQPWGGAAFTWGDTTLPDRDGATIWSIHPESSTTFAPSHASFMINYRVADLAATLADLREAGCTVDDRVDDSEFGKFGWVTDPEGNRVELWEPPRRKA